MAQSKNRVDWTNREALKDQVKHSLDKFKAPELADDEAERPLSPGLVARITEPTAGAAFKNGNKEDANTDRIYRETERSRINQSPNSAWPG
jgi:hypothetical protein